MEVGCVVVLGRPVRANGTETVNGLSSGFIVNEYPPPVSRWCERSSVDMLNVLNEHASLGFEATSRYSHRCSMLRDTDVPYIHNAPHESPL